MLPSLGARLATLLGPPPHARPHDLAVDAPAAYDCGGASAATGYSVDVTRNAVKAEDLVARYVTVAGRTLAQARHRSR